MMSIVVLLAVCSCGDTRQDRTEGEKLPVGETWITTGDKNLLFKRIEDPLQFSALSASFSGAMIEVDTTQRFQTIDGFGYSLTGGSAYLIHQKLDSNKRDALLRELFLAEGNGIGISYLRVSIGASDLDDHVFSYNDLPAGQTDMDLLKFTIAEDQKYLIPVLKAILKLNPKIKIMGSPWSAPAWMKTNKSPKGGSLHPKFYSVYANYIAKYLQAMAAEGIVLDAITLQNEPENPNNNPSMVMTAREQADFVKHHLGPAFERAGLKTKIVIFDHNCDHPEYPIAILNDTTAKQYIDGTAFHLYLGEIDALSTVHNAHPDKSIYFTEQWTSPQGSFDGDLKWHVRNLIIGASRNWSKTVLEWNLANDPDYNPHTTDGGCTECLGALTIGDSITRNVSYYIIAHASKFVRPGAVRIGSSQADSVYTVAFLNPDGRKVLIVLNDGNDVKEFAIRFNDNVATISLPAGAVGTYVW